MHNQPGQNRIGLFCRVIPEMTKSFRSVIHQVLPKDAEAPVAIPAYAGTRKTSVPHNVQ